jgi:hypothetical protein
MNSSTRGRISSRSAHPLLKTGKNRYHSHGWNIPYSKVSVLRMRASGVERFGLLAGRG